MKTYGEVDVEEHVFLRSAITGGDWLASRPSRFTPAERVPDSRWTGGWVCPRDGLDDMEGSKSIL
jgi:hypothetical protein